MDAKSTQTYSSLNPISQTTPVEKKTDEAHTGNTGFVQGKWKDHTTRATEVPIGSNVPTGAESQQARVEQQLNRAEESVSMDGNDAENAPFIVGLQGVAKRVPSSAQDSAGVTAMQQQSGWGAAYPRAAAGVFFGGGILLAGLGAGLLISDSMSSDPSHDRSSSHVTAGVALGAGTVLTLDGVVRLIQLCMSPSTAPST